MRDGDDMAAVHTDEQAGIGLGLGLGNRPRTHPLAGAIVDLGIVGVGPDASDISRVDEMGAVGPLYRQPRRGDRARLGRGAGGAGPPAGGARPLWFGTPPLWVCAASL